MSQESNTLGAGVPSGGQLALGPGPSLYLSGPATFRGRHLIVRGTCDTPRQQALLNWALWNFKDILGIWHSAKDVNTGHGIIQSGPYLPIKRLGKTGFEVSLFIQDYAFEEVARIKNADAAVVVYFFSDIQKFGNLLTNSKRTTV